MPRYELIDGSSSKFWQIMVSGASFTTTHGRIGSAGVSKTKDFADKISAKEAADKLIVTKVKKGYEKVAAKKAAPKKAVARKAAPRKAVVRKAAPKKSVAKKTAPKKAVAQGVMRFELIDGASSKFWEIETKQASYTVCYGRIGTNGQSKTKELGSASAAKEKQDKLIEEKVKKGYVLVGGVQPDKKLPKTVKGKAKKSASSRSIELKFQLSDYDHETDRHAEIHIDVNELRVTLERRNEANSSWQEYNKIKPKEWVTEKTLLFVSGKALTQFVEKLLTKLAENYFHMWDEMDELEDEAVVEHYQKVLGGIAPELALSGKQRVGKVPSKTLTEWGGQ